MYYNIMYMKHKNITVYHQITTKYLKISDNLLPTIIKISDKFQLASIKISDNLQLFRSSKRDASFVTYITYKLT